MARGTSRNRVHNGIRTRFLDQVSLASFRPAELLTLEVANFLNLKNTFYAEAESQTGDGTTRDQLGRIDGTSVAIFRNVNLSPLPSALDDPGLINRVDIYINGLFLEKSAWVNGYPVNSGNDLVMQISNQAASLENNLDNQDLITITGKVISVS
jgi:hypothetical protein